MHASALPPDSIFVTGPTASGKSEFSLLVAERLNGEIISVDSMQVYRGMDIGTAKPSRTDRARVPHHLIDVCDLNQSFNAARFVELALAAAVDIQARKRIPIFCGGTGLYFKSLLSGLGAAPPGDPVLRAELEAIPLPMLLSELERSDPQLYAQIDTKNPRRVIRALEVFRLTGKPFSAQRARWSESKLEHSGQPHIYALTRPRSELHERINTRVDVMFELGLVRETKQLLELGLASNTAAMQALGYRQVVEHLRGDRPLGATVELVKLRTRQFAKRQLTWFKTQLRPTWIELSAQSRLAEAASLIR